MKAQVHSKTAPEDRIGMPQRIAYGAGAFVNNLMAAASGGMMIVLNLGFGMNPALVGLLGALPRLTDAFTDPLMGYISDNTRSRWGRRRPYIFGGVIVAGLIFALLWQMPRGHSETFYFVWFLVGSILFYMGYTIFATPWVALGYELTPDYHERTRLMGTQNFIGQLAYVVSPWFLWIMNSGYFFRDDSGEPDQIAGAAGLAVVVALVAIALGILPAIFLRERMRDVALAEVDAAGTGHGFKQNMAEFFKGFRETMSNGPFLKLSAATFLVFNGFILISSFQFYVVIYYVCGGDQTAGAKYAGWAGTVGAVCTFAVVAFVTWLSTRIGKRHAFFVSIGLSIIGYGLKWVCYNPQYPWLVVLPAPLMAFGLGGLFTLVPSMVADVVDTDELKTHERREGMYGSIFWWMVKLGLSAALAGSGYLLNATGFDVDLEGARAPGTIFWMRFFDAGIPMFTSALAIWAVCKFPITEAKALEVRQELERRRGRPEVADAPRSAPDVMVELAGRNLRLRAREWFGADAAAGRERAPPGVARRRLADRSPRRSAPAGARGGRHLDRQRHLLRPASRWPASRWPRAQCRGDHRRPRVDGRALEAPPHLRSLGFRGVDVDCDSRCEAGHAGDAWRLDRSRRRCGQSTGARDGYSLGQRLPGHRAGGERGERNAGLVVPPQELP